MDIKTIKRYLEFIIIVGLFIIVFGATFYIYLGWNDPVDSQESSVEVNLPVLKWAEYNNLSKKRPDDNITGSNTP